MEGLLWQLHLTFSFFPRVWRWMGSQYVQIPGQKSVSNSRDIWLDSEYSLSDIRKRQETGPPIQPLVDLAKIKTTLFKGLSPGCSGFSFWTLTKSREKLHWKKFFFLIITLKVHIGDILGEKVCKEMHHYFPFSSPMVNKKGSHCILSSQLNY